MRRRLALLLCLLAVVACTARDTSVITRAYFAPTYGPGLLNTAGKYDAIALEIAGNPFREPKSVLDQAVLAAVRSSSYGAHIPFTVDGPDDPRSPFRLIAIFTPSPLIGHADICAGSRARLAEAPQAGRIELMLTYCMGEQALSSLRARRGGLASPYDPAFDAFVRNAAATLFSPRSEAVGPRGEDGIFLDW